MAPVEATAEVEPAAVVAMVPEQVWPPTVHDFVPAAQGAAVQEDDPVFTHAPLVQVKVALPELPLLDDTVLATPSSAADTLAPHVTPGAPDHETCPPLHGIAAAVPPTEGTQLGMGVFTDHWYPAGHPKPGLAVGVPVAVCAVALPKHNDNAVAATTEKNVEANERFIFREYLKKKMRISVASPPASRAGRPGKRSG